jgi:phosphoacetylglucosamine mutase
MEAFLEKYPVPKQDGSFLVLNYGTAGFRSQHENMDHVVARLAFIAAFESTISKNQFVGICITASHNPECDNGVKFIRSDGKLPTSEFEMDVTRFINSENPIKEFEAFTSKYSKVKTPENCKPQKNLNQAYVLIGHDTRPSSNRLVTIVCEALQSIHASFYNFGVITTTQLNFYVQYFNIPQQYNYILKVSCHKTLKLTQDSYFSWFSSRFQLFLQSWETVRKENPSFNDLAISQTNLDIDGANGSGGHQFSYFIKLLDLINVRVKMFNDGSSPGSVINKDCGADFVKKQKKCPINIGHESQAVNRDCLINSLFLCRC